MARPCPTEIDFEMMLDVVSSAAWIIFAPVSWCWPSLASAMEMTSPRALRPFRTTPGYFMVSREPMLQSIHFTSASSCAMAALGHEIEDVRRPVLHGDVLDLRALHRDQLDHRAVQRGRLEFRRGAAFHVHHLRAFIGDDERALELPEVLRIDAEVGLERVLHLHARRHVDERAAARRPRSSARRICCRRWGSLCRTTCGKSPGAPSGPRSSRRR